MSDSDRKAAFDYFKKLLADGHDVQEDCQDDFLAGVAHARKEQNHTEYTIGYADGKKAGIEQGKAEATPSIPIQELISYLEAKRDENLDYYDKRIPEAGFSLGALEMRTERDAYKVIFEDLIRHFRVVKLNKEKKMAGQ